MENEELPSAEDSALHEKIALIESGEQYEVRDGAKRTSGKSNRPSAPKDQRTAAGSSVTGTGGQRDSRESLPKRKKTWLMTVAAAAALSALIVWFVPPLRYAMLNTVGQRADITIRVYEQSTSGMSRTTLRRVGITVDGKQYDTDASSTVTIPGLTYGEHTVKVSKMGYREFQKVMVVDMPVRSAQKLDVALVAVGTPVSFLAKDFVSEAGITNARFELGDKTVRPDESGRVKLVVPPTDSPTVSVAAKFDGAYIDKTIDISIADKTEKTFAFVPAGKHYFVSKRSGVYSVYSSNVDGSDQQEVIKGTPQETSGLVFAASPDGRHALMASTRDGKRDERKELVQQLYWVDLATRQMDVIDQGYYFSFYDWSDDVLVYSSSYYAAKATEMSRRLRSVSSSTKNLYDLSMASGYISQVAVSNGTVLVLQGEYYGKPEYESSPILKSVGVKGDGSRNLATRVGDFRQVGFDTFTYMTESKQWMEYNTNSAEAKSANPPSEDSKVYLTARSASTNKRLFIDNVDGKNTLNLQSADTAPRVLVSSPGLRGPIRWINDTTLVYRIVTPAETADYVVSTAGGRPRKIVDVTATATAGQGTPNGFYYY